MKNFKNTSIGLALLIATALVAGCTNAGAAESLELVNAELADVRSQIATVQAELQARGIDTTGIAPVVEAETVPDGSVAAQSGGNLELTPLENFTARVLGLRDWMGQDVAVGFFDSTEHQNFIAACMEEAGQPYFVRQQPTMDRNSREFASTYGFDTAGDGLADQARNHFTAEMTEAESNAYWDAFMLCQDAALTRSSVEGNLARESFSDLSTAVQRTANQTHNWERDEAFRASWLVCLAEAGFTPAADASWHDTRSLADINGFWEAMNAPIDPAAFANWDWAANPNGPTSTAVNEFIERERELATANWDCLNMMNGQEFFNVSNKERIDRAIEAHSTELQEWFDAYQAAVAAQ